MSIIISSLALSAIGKERGIRVYIRVQRLLGRMFQGDRDVNVVLVDLEKTVEARASEQMEG